MDPPVERESIPSADLLGIALAITDYERTLEWIDRAVARGHRGYLCVAAVHTVMASREDPALREAVLGADFTVPDGQPLVWALRLLGQPLEDRVYGPELMERACARAAASGQRFYLYGGRNQGALLQLARNLRLRHPGLRIVGGHCPPFRALTAEEEDAVARDINRSGADVVWVGIGVPKQEKWMAAMRARLEAPVLVGVGAAFDFHAGLIPQAPDAHAAPRPGVAVPARAGARAPVAALPALQPALRRRVHPPVRRAPPVRPSYDVAVVGLGRVGLPLAIAFADRGLTVLGVDKDADRLETLRAARMPFKEPGTEEPLARVLEAGSLALSARADDAAQADAIVLTLGTPMLSHIEIDMSDIRTVLDALLPHLRAGHLLVLRSTVAPGTTEFVAGYLEKQRGFRVGEDVFVAHVPERIAADRFMAEIGTLPCIVGGVGDGSGERAERLFEVLGAPIVRTSPVQAELAKIWANILRYSTFALPNLLMMDCERYGANVFDVIELINRDYPRGGIAQPGFTAGTCLRKDFAFSEERSNAPGMLLAVSRVNESVPLFLVEGMQAAARRPARAQGRRARARVQGRHRRRARLALAQADPAARARAGRRRDPRPGRGDAYRGVRGGRGRRRRRRGGDQPLRLLQPGGARYDRADRRARLPRRRSVERVRRRAGVRVRERSGCAEARLQPSVATFPLASPAA